LNTEFKKRQSEVLEILSKLAKKAEGSTNPLVFIGGSAIQTAALKTPKRLSVDLDLHYLGDFSELLADLGQDYRIEIRPAKRTDLFSYHNVLRNEVQVKVDVTRFPLIDGKTPWQEMEIKRGGKKFKANVATPSYLLASKFSTLAIGTVGRKPFHEIDFLKDVFDINCLLDEFGWQEEIFPFFKNICAIQNRIRETNYTFEQSIESAVKALALSADTDDAKASIKKADLGNFVQYLFDPALAKKHEYWVMAYRLIAYLNFMRTMEASRIPEAALEMEKNSKRSAEGAFIAEIERKLAAGKVDADLLHKLKIFAPKALVHMHYSKPEAFGKE